MDNLNPYEIAYKRAGDPATREEFWYVTIICERKEQAQFVSWHKEPTTILSKRKENFYDWFADGQLNFCHNLVDRHLKERANQTALVWESNMVNQTAKYTY